jgi:nucleotide sugar dehydrogenase
MSIAVIGLGKIGLPMAAQYASKGHRVVGVDSSPDVVRDVNEGRSHVVGEPFLAERVSDAVSTGLLRATEDISAAVASADVVVVAVSLVTGNDGKADFRAIDQVTQSIGTSVKAGTMILYETTLPLGTTRDRLAPALERRSGLRLGENLFLAFSPERVYSGRVFQDLATYPKIVGGVDPQSTSRATAFYSSVLDAPVLPLANAETAEFAKLAETTYRFVNIALADELALFGRSRGVDVSEAFAAANTQPFSHIHQPGIGIGGHCIPVYPRFLLEAAQNGELSLVQNAKMADAAMPDIYLQLLSEALGGLRGKRVIVLGVSYRPDVKETAFSAAFPLVAGLSQRGAMPIVHDPLFTEQELKALGFEPTALDADTSADAVIVQAFHTLYRDLDWMRMAGLRAVVDGRGSLPTEAFNESGVALISLGSMATNGATGSTQPRRYK